MFFKTNYPDLYNAVLQDIAHWFLNEIKTHPLDEQMVDGVQTNALLNFITFDMHALETAQGYNHFHRILQAIGTEQTVMIRLKDLVIELYAKYGERDIDGLRKRIYKATDSIYGLSRKSEDMDVNATLWLYPFFKHIYTTVPTNIPQ